MYPTKSIYLAGPITGLSYKDATHGWRAEFPKLLNPHIVCSSPMRHKKYLNTLQVLGLDGNSREVYNKNALSTAAGITTRDHNDVYTCDLVVANFLGAKTGSLGTAVEFGWASAYKKPIIMIVEGDFEDFKNPHDHMMLNHLAGFRVSTLEEAAVIANTLLTPGID